MLSDISVSLFDELNNNLFHYPQQAARVFHGRGHFFAELSQLNIEWYPPYIFVQCFSETLCDNAEAALDKLFSSRPEIGAVLVQKRTWPEISTSVLHDRLDTSLPVASNTQLSEHLLCQASLGKNRNTGVFLDMRSGWNWVRENAHEKNVLNLFSYTGVFSLFALQGGATKVVNMDMSAGALKTAQRNHQLNGMNSGQASYYKRDILKSAKQFSSLGPFDLIITDPPPYQKKAFRGWQDYKKLLTWCRNSLNENGTILASLNNPQATLEEFEYKLRESFPDAKSFTCIESSFEIKEQDKCKGLKLIAVEF
jgi:23S rRNA (cytosine1962-C5)-methyltransferase